MERPPGEGAGGAVVDADGAEPAHGGLNAAQASAKARDKPVVDHRWA